MQYIFLDQNKSIINILTSSMNTEAHTGPVK